MADQRLEGIRPLLFLSGVCALVYQVTWTRELRLIFGASFASSAAVLAVFMGGLGVGGIVLGRRVESKASRLRSDGKASSLGYYARLEIVVALSSAVTPVLVRLVRAIYLAMGGQATLGGFGATLVRLLLSAVVLGVPTFFMGGTLPAAARAASTAGDAGRKAVAGLYAANTFGAVTGALLANFVMLEIVGNRLTLWIACLVNVLVAMFARSRARSISNAPKADDEPRAGDTAIDRLQTRFTFAVAAAAGFGFLLLELVWYRMLSPLLGGSSYTFGLILAMALLGIAIGGATYARRPGDAPARMRELANVCALEALAIAVPFALGDRIAELALLLRPLGAFGFYGHVAAWSVVAGIVVLPTAIVAGYQFPLLIGLLGHAREGVARDVGLAYGWNTAGAIAGSCAAGFYLLPRFGAERCWTAVVVVFVLLALACGAVAHRSPGPLATRLRDLVLVAVAALASLLAIRADGPTAAWRHSPIGVGRMDGLLQSVTQNSVRSWMRDRRRQVVWQEDGVESSVGAQVVDEYGFVVNGRTDGSARADADTQVLSGLISALLVPEAKTALIVGLGTGCTAGWLAEVPGMERVDVVELEATMRRVARDLAPVNRNVLDAPNVHITINDAREVLQTTRRRYDIIFSEPSNPYRAGISSLYTRDFYEAVQARLEPSGVFVQWLQLYDVDGFTVRTAIATIRSVFPHVSLWETTHGDLLMTATKEPLAPSLARMRQRLDEEPFKTAFRVTWGLSDVEGVLAHHLAAPALADVISETAAINTDDLNLLEYSFARNVGEGELRADDELWAMSTSAGSDLPAWARGIDLATVERRRMVASRDVPSRLTPELRLVKEVFVRLRSGDLDGAAKALEKAAFVPQSPAEAVIVAALEVRAGASDAQSAIDRVRAVAPTDALALDAMLASHRGELETAATALAAAFAAYRGDPWADLNVRSFALDLVGTIAARQPALARQLYDALAAPFVIHGDEAKRLGAWLLVAKVLDGNTGTSCQAVFHAYEPFTPWTRPFLRDRRDCYKRAGDPLVERASAELALHTAASPTPLAEQESTSR